MFKQFCLMNFVLMQKTFLIGSEVFGKTNTNYFCMILLAAVTQFNYQVDLKLKLNS